MSDEHGGDGTIQCSLCTKTFKQRKELFHHMSSAAHRRQSVRCPWCRKMHVFTRVYDLSRHCDSVHFREYSLMPEGFLSVPNCFYLAVYPKEYASMTKIQKYDSTIAIEARRLLIGLLDNIKAGDELRYEIREGWKAGLKIAEEIEKKDKERKEAMATAAKKYKKRKNGKENETPAKTMKQKGTLEETKAVYEQMFNTDPIKLKIPNTKSNDTPPMSETECENAERNEKNMKVVLTRLDENGVRRLMVVERKNGKVEKEELIGKPFKAESESFKTVHVKTVAKVEVSKTVMTEEEDKVVDEVNAVEELMTEKEKLDGEVSLDEKSMTEEEKVVDRVKAVETIMAEEKLEGENSVGEKMMAEEKVIDEVSVGKILMETEKEVDEGVVVMKEDGNVVDEVSIDSETVMNDQIKVVDESCRDETIMKEQVEGVDKVSAQEIIEDRCVETEEKESLNNTLKGELPLMAEFLANKTMPSEIDDSQIVTKHTEKRKTSYKDYMKKVRFTKPTKEKISNIDGGEIVVNEKGDAVEIQKGEDDIWRRVKDINNNDKASEENVMGQESGESDKLNGKVKSIEEREFVESYEPESEQSEELKYVTTAIKILEKGAMPLCPPARRQWGPDTLEEMNLGHDQVIQWPPKGWLNMTPDKRLLTVEMMAMTVEAFLYGAVAPEMSRCYLLDKYKFLMLPGALIHRKEKGEDTITRTRFQNFKFLKEVAAGKKLSFGEVEHLRALEFVSINQKLPLDPSHFTTPLQLQEGPSYLD